MFIGKFANTVRPVTLVLAAACAMAPCMDTLQANEKSHPLSKVTGTFYVTGKRVSARLRIFVEDLYLFHEMEPDDEDRLYAADLEPARELHRQFLLERVRILDADGQPLPARVLDVSPLEVPASGWSVDELMEHTLDYDLEYDLEFQPEFLTIVQDIVDVNFVFPSELEMVLRQEGNPEITAEILRPGDPYTVRFDWEREALDPEASEKQLQEWFNQAREETLGITSYDSVYSFLYVTRREVRHEILIPLGTLANIFEIPHADPNFLKVPEQDTARELIEQYYSEGNPVKIDGVQVAPITERIDFYGLSLKDFAQQAEARDVSMASGRVGIILVYPCKQEPSTVELTWTKFTSDVRKVDTVVFALDETTKAEFSRFKKENTYVWNNPNEVQPRTVERVTAELPPAPRYPVLSLALVAAWLAASLLLPVIRSRKLVAVSSGLLVLSVATLLALWHSSWTPLPFAKPPQIATEDQQTIVRTLLANVYRAFDYREEEEIYDSLAQSVTGDLLSNLYLEIRKSLEVKEQGGAVALVDHVEFVEVQPTQADPAWSTEPPGFAIRCRWNVEGTVEHWGHIHRRTNQYAADFAIEPFEGNWRLVAIELNEEKRLQNKRELRRF